MKRTYFLTLVLAAAIAGGCGRDDNERAAAPGAGSAPVGTSGDAAADVSRGDQDFVHDAAIAGMAEIDMARMALDRSRDANVKKFAQMMIDDHTKAGEALKAAAAAAALAPPSDTLDETHMRLVNDLTQDKPGESFDADYMHMQVDAHNDAVKLFGDYVKNGKVPQVRSFAEATLPTLEMHKTRADSVADAASKAKPS
jgi:putative membrane protein